MEEVENVLLLELKLRNKAPFIALCNNQVLQNDGLMDSFITIAINRDFEIDFL